MPKYDTDVVVIGAGIGGLTIGALLANKGFNVIVVEQAPQAGGLCSAYKYKDYSFQVGGNILNGFELGGGHERVLAELGLFIKKTQLNIPFQIIMPEHRLNISTNPVELFTEFEREFPEQLADIKDFWQYMENLEETFNELSRNKSFCSPQSIKEKYTFFKQIQQPLNKKFSDIEKSCIPIMKGSIAKSEFKRLLDVICFFYTRLPIEGCSRLFFSYLLGIIRRGVFYINGGAQELANKLVEYIANNRGVVKYNLQVSNIITAGQKAVGVKLANGKEIKSKYVIADTTIWNLY